MAGVLLAALFTACRSPDLGNIGPQIDGSRRIVQSPLVSDQGYAFKRGGISPPLRTCSRSVLAHRLVGSCRSPLGSFIETFLEDTGVTESLSHCYREISSFPYLTSPSFQNSSDPIRWSRGSSRRKCQSYKDIAFVISRWREIQLESKRRRGEMAHSRGCFPRHHPL